MNKLNLILVALTGLMVSACGGGSAGSVSVDALPSDTPSQVQPASNSTARILSLNLSRSNLDRDPEQTPPSRFELPPLNQLDNSLRAGASYNTRYAEHLSRVMSNALFQAQVGVYIEDDMRLNNSVSHFIGGYTGHSVIALDGKFIDILWEVATYMAGAEHGIYISNKDQAVTAVVSAQNNQIGFLGEQVFFRNDLSSAAQVRADYLFESLAAGILYHEYGHYYHYHSLDHARAANTPDEQRVSGSPFNEDQADEVAGMLLAKAGYDVSLGSEMLDIMAYYGFQRNSPSLSYRDVTDNESIQQRTYELYSSYADRKSRIRNSASAYDNNLSVAQN